MPRAAVAAPTVGTRGRKEVHSGDFQIADQKPITDKMDRNDVSREKDASQRLFGRRLKQTGEVIMLDGIEVDAAYLAELAFYEEPVTIVINASTHKNAASIFENWSNGLGAEMLVNGKWLVVRDLPISKPITIKRKVVEQIIRARITNVNTAHQEPPVEQPRNEIIRTSSQVHSFSILRDESPRSQDWLTMAYARPI